MYEKHTLQEYEKAIDLREKFGWGSTKISSFLSKRGIRINKRAIDGWIYRNKKPFCETLIKKISEKSNLLNSEKAYVLGVLCGDGYVSTGNRIGLAVCDKDFAEFFKICLEDVYGLECTSSIRKRNNPKANLQYVVSLVSKNVVDDLRRYCNSFKTKDWKVPKLIKDSNKETIAFFLRGLYDSEGSVRFRRNGYGVIQFYSTNLNATLEVEELLKHVFGIDSKIVHRRSGESYILEITYYKDIKKFYEEINFCMMRKQVKLFQLIGSYKRKGLRNYNKEFKLKCLKMLKGGYSAPQIGKLLNFPYTNIYDFIKQHEK